MTNQHTDVERLIDPYGWNVEYKCRPGLSSSEFFQASPDGYVQRHMEEIVARERTVPGVVSVTVTPLYTADALQALTGEGNKDLESARELRSGADAAFSPEPSEASQPTITPHDPKVYEDLGRACERHGLAWVGDDGEFRFRGLE